MLGPGSILPWEAGFAMPSGFCHAKRVLPRHAGLAECLLERTSNWCGNHGNLRVSSTAWLLNVSDQEMTFADPLGSARKAEVPAWLRSASVPASLVLVILLLVILSPPNHRASTGPHYLAGTRKLRKPSRTSMQGLSPLHASPFDTGVLALNFSGRSHGTVASLT